MHLTVFQCGSARGSPVGAEVPRAPFKKLMRARAELIVEFEREETALVSHSLILGT